MRSKNKHFFLRIGQQYHLNYINKQSLFDNPDHIFRRYEMAITTNLRLPGKNGKLDIYPEIHEGNIIEVTIIGDPDGLRYLSKLLKALADYDQNSTDIPKGEREHIHLHANCQLGNHLCEVEVCRADAKGIGELPDFMK